MYRALFIHVTVAAIVCGKLYSPGNFSAVVVRLRQLPGLLSGLCMHMNGDSISGSSV